MMSKVQNRVNKLEISVRLLEAHLHKYGHLLQPRPLRFIKYRINTFKRELGIRKDFPT